MPIQWQRICWLRLAATAATTALRLAATAATTALHLETVVSRFGEHKEKEGEENESKDPLKDSEDSKLLFRM